VAVQREKLPLAVVIDFADLNKDQQPNNTRSSRPLATTEASGEKVLDMTTLAINVDDARGLAERYFRRLWNSRRKPSLSVTQQQLALEPGDVATIELDGNTATYQLRRMTITGNGEIETEWYYDAPTLATIPVITGGTSDGQEEGAITIPSLSNGFVQDIPLLEDVEDSSKPLLHLGAAPYNSGGTWLGASINEYDVDEGVPGVDVIFIPSSDASTWGRATDVLPDIPTPYVWDRGSTINVDFRNGSPTSSTEAAIDVDGTINLMLAGSELLNFATATLEGDGTYTLSDLKRGRRGTEWAMTTHVAGEEVWLLDLSETLELGLSDVGTDLAYIPVSLSRGTGGAYPILIEPFTGASLKPYSPVNLEGLQDPDTADWALSWDRRTRVGGDWVGGAPIPLSEAFEKYEIEIYNGTTLVRTLVAEGTPSVTYTAEDQITDFGSVQISLDWTVYQISDAVGRGFSTSTTSTGVTSSVSGIIYDGGNAST